MTENKITVTTLPHTDLWQRTYYHFRNDNAPVFQMETEEKFFSFVVKTDFADSSFTAEFTNIALTECAWKAHDGQRPDEE